MTREVRDHFLSSPEPQPFFSRSPPGELPQQPLANAHCILYTKGKKNALCSFRSIFQAVEWSLQLLLQSFRLYVYICQKVNIFGNAPSAEELQNVKYKLGCQMSSGKALDSCLGSTNYQRPTGPWAFVAAPQTVSGLSFWAELLSELRSGKYQRVLLCCPFVSDVASCLPPSSCVMAVMSPCLRAAKQRWTSFCRAHISLRSQRAAKGFTATAGKPH